MPVLPDKLKNDLVAEAIKIFNAEKNNRALSYGRLELENTNCLNHMDGDNEDIGFYEKSGGVSAMRMSDQMGKATIDFFNQAKHPATKQFNSYAYLYVEGGPFCGPHIDDVAKRRHGLQLLLKAGGEDVRTAWYEPKEQYKNLPIIDYCCIPYSKIDLKAETCLEENNWYWMKFDSIHSIENLQSLRVFLLGIENNFM
jgi:hypothetical protein